MNVLKIDVIFSASEIRSSAVKDKTVVVIDVLRATSVMVTALQNGASKVVPVLTPEAAFEYRDRSGPDVLLAGERNSELIEGFDHGNSPLDMTGETVRGKTIVITTTNGTRAINGSLEAADIFVAAFLNAGATVRELDGAEDVVLVCSGSNGGFTMEDTLCAGLMADSLALRNQDAVLTDAVVAARQLYTHARTNIHRMAGEGRHYRLLWNKGYSEDLQYCFQPDLSQVVCRMKEGVLWAERS
ncbi:MAG: 2-phosphosulfolactate phosphatase [Bacteroidota bacterium]